MQQSMSLQQTEYKQLQEEILIKQKMIREEQARLNRQAE